MNRSIRHKNKLVTKESLFIRGPLSRIKELGFAFKVFFNFIFSFSPGFYQPLYRGSIALILFCDDHEICWIGRL